MRAAVVAIALLLAACQAHQTARDLSVPSDLSAPPDSSVSPDLSVPPDSSQPSDGASDAAGSANLVLSPSTPQAFGPVTVGSSSATVPFTFTNMGGGDSVALTTAINPPGSFVISADGCAGTTLGPAQKCTFAVTFTPPDAGDKTAELDVSGVAAVTLTGTGLTPGTLTAMDASHDFMDVTLGQTDSVVLTFTNHGGSPSGPLASALSGAAAGDYSITADQCQGNSIAAGASCAVTVRFAPSMRSVRLASLVVSGAPSGDAQVSLSGVGRDIVQLTLVVGAGNGSGTVASGSGIAVGGTEINCPSTCTASFYRNTQSADLPVSLSATSVSSNATFDGLGAGPIQIVHLGDAPTTVTVHFTLKVFTLSFVSKVFSIDAHNTVTANVGGINCDGPCLPANVQLDYGTTVTFTATPGASTVFDWSPPCHGAGTTCTFSLQSDTVLRVVFSSYNFAFATQQTFAPGNFGGLAGADAKCQSAADSVGLPGTYLAYLSTSTVDAADHIKSNPLNANPRGWIRMDGKPVADTVALLTTGDQIMYPINTDERGVQLGVAYTTSGSTAEGHKNGGSYCGDWTVVDSGGTVLGCIGTGSGAWLGCAGGNCNFATHIYCFGTSLTQALAFPPEAGQIVFLSKGVFSPPPAPSPMPAADTLCHNEAVSAGLTAGGADFQALLAPAGTAPASRFNSSGGTWVRPDGVRLTTTFNGVFNPSAAVSLTSLSVHADGTYSTGATLVMPEQNLTAVVPAGQNCNDWTDTTSASHFYTSAYGPTLPWQGLLSQGPFGCNTISSQLHLVCLQK